ncbi:MAG: alpha-ketoglutarate-dependent dioxygenase AlkB, partial [Pyrinomonadaceae bacterium]
MAGLFSLFAAPDGFEYGEEMITSEEEKNLIDEIRKLNLKPFDFYGYEAKRRVASFGWRYDYGDRSLKDSTPLPEFLMHFRERAAEFAGLTTDQLVMALVSEYTPGTPIGWHRDRSVFGDVVGISLLSSCTFRFRRKIGTKWERQSLDLEPRSMYVLRGPARNE